MNVEKLIVGVTIATVVLMLMAIGAITFACEAIVRMVVP